MSAENRDRAALLEEIQRLRLRLVTLEQDAGEQAPDDLCCVSLALRHAPCGAIVSSTTIDGTIQYVNAEFTAITGYELSDIPTVAAWTDLAYPDPSYRTRVLANWHQDIGEPGRDVVYTVCCKDGSQKEIQLRAASLPNERMVSLRICVWLVSQHWLGVCVGRSRTSPSSYTSHSAYILLHI